MKRSGASAPAETPEIPDKLYFRIGEVSRLAGVKQYVLRYWESEFSALQPKKSGTNHRLYRRKDVELILEIKRLLYDKRFTIEGARNVLAAQRAPEAAKPASGRKQKEQVAAPAQVTLFHPQGDVLAQIRSELREILGLLD